MVSSLHGEDASPISTVRPFVGCCEGTGVRSPSPRLDVLCDDLLSSITASTLRSLDSDFLCECDEEANVGGKDCLRLVTGGDVEGDVNGEVAGDEDVTSAHAALPSGKNPPVGFAHELLFDEIPSLLFSSSGVEDVNGLGLADGVFAMTERGGRMLKILSSSGGGPYESKGSGMAWSMGSMTGSELWNGV